MSNKPKTRQFYRWQSVLNVAPPSYHPLKFVLALLCTALLVGWLLGLGSTTSELSVIKPIAPISVMTLTGTINARVPIDATCGEHMITTHAVTESARDVQSARDAHINVPMQLTFESLEPLVDAYYTLAAPHTTLTLELHDASGNVTRRFEAQAGTVDIRKHGIYIAAQLRDETSALVYVSAQTHCQANA
jgi:hypothetical protein